MHGVDLTKAFDMLDWTRFFLQDLFLAHDFYHIKLKSMIGVLLLDNSITIVVSTFSGIWLGLESSKNEAFVKASFLLNKTKLFTLAKALFY